MGITNDMLRRELEEVNKSLAVAKREKEQADRKVAGLEAKRQAFTTLLADDESSSDTSASDSSDSLAESSTPTKRSLIRTQLKNAGASGAKPVTIYKALKSQGVKRAYVHSTLSRMKDSGEVTERNGLYTFVAVQ
jgi:hypothetical protein